MRRRSIFIGLATLVGVLLLAWAARPGWGVGRRGYGVDSVNNMRQIALATSGYEMDHHNNMPPRLGDLFPDYASDPRTFVFYSPYSNPSAVFDIQVHPELIDAFTPYSLMRLPDKRILVVERPGLWKDGTISYVLRRENGTTEGDAQSDNVSPEEFARRLSRNFQ